MVLTRRKSTVATLPYCAPAPCPVQLCMDLLGGAWTPSIVWKLSGAPRRFSELQDDIANISAKMLSARLKDLAAKGVISRSVIPTSPPTVEYVLTDLGRELLPVIMAIETVGRKLVASSAGV